MRAEIARFNPKMLVRDLQPMDAVVEKAQASTRFSLLLIGVFATVALLLAAVGLYGVLATVVRQRTAEIGVRMALGAAPGSIFGLVVGQGMRLSAAGIAAGLLAALALTRVMTTMLVGVKPTDPVHLCGHGRAVPRYRGTGVLDSRVAGLGPRSHRRFTRRVNSKASGGVLAPGPFAHDDCRRVIMRTVNDEQKWASVQRREKAADGAFVFAVKTTGVYCRPSCAARSARRQNMTFYTTCEEAERGGLPSLQALPAQ